HISTPLKPTLTSFSSKSDCWLTFETLYGGLQFSFGCFATLPPLSPAPFARFQILIAGKEMLIFEDKVLVAIFEFLNIIETRIGWHTQHLIIATAAVGHGKDRNRTGFNHDVGHQIKTWQIHQRIQRIAVFT